MLSTAPDGGLLKLPANAMYELAESIWGGLLELDVQRLDAPQQRSWSEDEILTGCVEFHGDWQGAMAFTCSKRLVRRAAAVMFKIPPEEVTDAELHDTLSELVHVFGVNLKSLLPVPCRLSQPSVTEGYNRLGRRQPLEQILLHCEGYPLQVTLFQQENTV